jgi:hypothetical protein
MKRLAEFAQSAEATHLSSVEDGGVVVRDDVDDLLAA